jgi:hypothetical protein
METTEYNAPTPVLARLQEDFERIHEYLFKLSDEIRSERISRYPIFIAQLQEIALGKPIPIVEHLSLNYSYNVSLLEELVKKDIITQDRILVFKESWKRADKYACFFLVTPLEAGFVFIPYDGFQVEE